MEESNGLFTLSQHLRNSFYIIFVPGEKAWNFHEDCLFWSFCYHQWHLLMRLQQSQYVAQGNLKEIHAIFQIYLWAIICFIPAGFFEVIVITDETLILLITPNVILGLHSHNTSVRKSYASLPVGCDLIWATYQELTSVFLFSLLKNFYTKL